jgi:hypothetical protein
VVGEAESSLRAIKAPPQSTALLISASHPIRWDRLACIGFLQFFRIKRLICGLGQSASSARSSPSLSAQSAQKPAPNGLILAVKRCRWLLSSLSSRK